MDVSGKVAVVTGSSSGVGRATAELLGSLGAKVVVNYAHSADGANEAVEAIRAAGGTAHAFQADVRHEMECRALVENAVDTYGALHILVNNAGMTHFIPHERLDLVTDEVWDDTFSVNVKGTFNCLRAAVPHMQAAGEGAIVNVASIAGIRGTGSSIAYAASKAAVINLTITTAKALGPTIRVNCVAPGFIDGRWLRGGLGESYDRAKERTTQMTPLKGVATPETVASSILGFIQYNTFVTGQTLIVDGGLSP